MSARVLAESALRVSDCVTELLRKQPFFGSLVLRLPLRPDFSRETLATDGHEIRYSPRWVAETDSHLIETAMARVVMACALKHHTRRGERDPERWQMASQLVTHALIRDAGFTLPPDAEAWDGLTVEQAYDRLQAEDGDPGDDGSAPPDAAGAGASPDGHASPDGDDGDSDDRTDSADDDSDDRDEAGDGDPDGEAGDDRDGDGHDQDGNGEGDGTSDAPPSHDPSGTGEVMDADARAGDDGEPADAPVDVNAEEQAWDEAMHQALNIARAEGKVPGRVEETIQSAHASTLDWRTLLRRYMTDAASHDYSWSVPNRRFIDGGLYLPSIRSEGIETIAFIIDVSSSLADPDARRVLGGAARGRGRDPPRERHRPPGRHGSAGRGRVRRRRPARGDCRQGPGRHRLPPGLRMARRAGHRAGSVPLLHRYGVLRLPRGRAAVPGAALRLRRRGKPLAPPRALGRAHPDRRRPANLAVMRAIHGAPAEALRQALKALAELSFWISWTSDPDLAPEPVVSARCMRDAAAALRKASRLLDEAADRADPPPHATPRAPAPGSNGSPDDPSGAGAGRPAAST